MTRRALVVGPGGLRGAYDAGVLTVLLKELGSGYFDSVYASSVGVFVAAYFVAGQQKEMEIIWRNHANGPKVFSLTKPFFKRQFLDLDYVIDLFKTGETDLDERNIAESKTRLVYMLATYPKGEIKHIVVNDKDVLEYARAASALPIAHRPVNIDGQLYSDIGPMSDPLSVKKALRDGHDEVLAVYNKPFGLRVSKRFRIVKKMASFFLPERYGELMRLQEKSWNELEKFIDSEPRVTVIRPKKKNPINDLLDTNRLRLNKTVDIGIADGLNYINTLKHSI